MKTLAERQKEFVEFFNEMDSWQDRFNYLIEIGEHLSPMIETHKKADTLISICASRTYFLATENTGRITIEGYSNSAIVSGLIAMLNVIFGEYQVEELQDLTIDFHYTTGLMDNMTEQRKATLEVMIERIKQLC